MHTHYRFSRDAQFTQGPGFLANLRARQHASEEEQLHSAAESPAVGPAREHDETYRQLVQSQTVLEAQLAEMRAAMDTQGTLLRRIMERVEAKGS